jgi:hypothetical protein
MKNYPLKIEAVHTDNELIYMSKGHHDPHEFMKALREYGERAYLSTPTQHWVKKTPANDGEHSCWYNIVDESCQGAFPATYSREYGDDVYELNIAQAPEATGEQHA